MNGRNSHSHCKSTLPTITDKTINIDKYHTFFSKMVLPTAHLRHGEVHLHKRNGGSATIS